MQLPTPTWMTLRRDLVHVWTISLPTEQSTPSADVGVLSSDEVSRAQRFVFAEDRRGYMHAHAALRHILGGYLNADPSSLSFAQMERGKPYLSGAHASSSLCFNLSHTRGLALCAIGLGREVGVDVETIARSMDVDGVARQAFSPAEQDALLQLEGEERKAAFFRVWTRKEAYVKAIGDGFSRNTRHFTVSSVEDDGDALLSGHLHLHDAPAWRIQPVQCPHGYCGAVAAAGRYWSVQASFWAPLPA